MPGRAAWHSIAAKVGPCPTVTHVRALLNMFRQLKYDLGSLLFTPVMNVRAALYVDGGRSTSSQLGRLGWRVHLVDADTWMPELREKSNCVLWACVAPNKTVYASSTGAETAALKEGLKGLWGIHLLAQELWGSQYFRPVVLCDSRALYDQLRAGKSASEPKLTPTIRYCIQELRELGAEFRWIERELQLADELTRLTWQSN
jgi:hypothetical protein